MHSNSCLRNALARALAMIVASFAVASCSFPDPPFDTHADRARLSGAKGGRVALIAFRHEIHVIINAHPPPAAAIEILLAHDKEQFLSQFGRMLPLVDATGAAARQAHGRIDENDPEGMARILRTLNFDAGFVVAQSYGFELMSGGLEEEARGKILKSVMPEKVAQAINGPATVQNYDMASDIRLIDRSGQTIWHLFGKAQDLPRNQDIFNPGEFARSFAGLDPSLQVVVRSMGRVADQYSDFAAWAIRRSLEGAGPPSYKAFLGDRRSSIMISPADSLSYAPFICGYDVMAPSRAKTGAPEPEECRVAEH